jgi:hypothetical protein
MAAAGVVTTVATEFKVAAPAITATTPTPQVRAVVEAALTPPPTQMILPIQYPWPVVVVALVYITWKTSHYQICPPEALAAKPAAAIIIPLKVMVVKDHHLAITPNRVVLVPTIQEYAATEPTPPEPVVTTAVVAQAA